MNGKEFIKAVKHITEEKEISEDVVFEGMEQALLTAYKKNFKGKTNVKVEIDRKTGDIRVYTYYVVVDEYHDGEEYIDEEGNTKFTEPDINEDAQVLLEDIIEKHPDAKVGDVFQEEVTPQDFGRVATSTAKQVLTQKVREAERESIMKEFEDKENEIMVGTLLMEDVKNYYVDLGRARAILPKSEIIPGEALKMGSSIRVYINKIENTTKGPLIKCTRKHYGFVKRLFETFIPEFKEGILVLHGVAREAGVRSKVSVSSLNPNIDAIGTCIGEKGSRIGSILAELNGEKVDLVLYSDDEAEYIKNALSPAKDVIVSIVDNTKNREALAIVEGDNQKLAIGKNGINIKLASKLTKFRINIKTMDDINKEANQ